MTDSELRDQFAAAALTGLLVHANDTIDDETLDTPSDIAYTAYQMADAMLRERANHPAMPDSCPTADHDAAPAARASLPTADHAVCRGREGGSGTGDTQEPVAWAALREDGDIAWIGYTPEGAADGACGRRIVPLYRQPQPTLTDAEREAIKAAAGGYEDDSRTFREEGSPFEAAHHAERAATLRGLLERLK